MINAYGNPDGTVTLSIAGGVATLTAAQLDEVISGLGRVRTQMTPQPPFDPPLLEKVEASVDPRFWVAAESMSNGILFLIRHLGFGWLPFLLPPKEAETLCRLLTEQLEALRSPKSGAH